MPVQGHFLRLTGLGLLRGPVRPDRWPRGLMHNGLYLLHALQPHRDQRLHQRVVEMLHVRRQVGQEPAQRSPSVQSPSSPFNHSSRPYSILKASCNMSGTCGTNKFWPSHRSILPAI